MAATVACHRAPSPPPRTAMTSCYPSTSTSTQDEAIAVKTPTSCAMTVLTAVERSVLRTLAFVFYQLEREQAKYCASSILRWYFQLQAQLPVSAVASLERVAESVIALSDPKFTTFWLSLLEKEIELSNADEDDELLESKITIQSYADYYEDRDGEKEMVLQTREKTLIRRLYQHIYCSIHRLFFSATPRSPTTERGLATQTPCTSPTDLSDESHYQKHTHSRRKHNRVDCEDKYEAEADECNRDDHISDSELSRSRYHRSFDSNQCQEAYSDDDSSSDEDEDLFEPGWAVDYMEQQESTVSTELTRRMRKMMHSTIPLNLFRVTVAYSSERQAEEAGEGGFVGVISPESFPPTPITRDLQTRKMNCYTVSVLDHATLALRLLETNSSNNSSSYPQQLR